MVKTILFSLVGLFVFLYAVASNFAAGDNGFSQVRTELKNIGISESEINSLEGTAKNLLKQGVSSDEIVSAVRSAQAEGLTGQALSRRVRESVGRGNMDSGIGTNRNMTGDMTNQENIHGTMGGSMQGSTGSSATGTSSESGTGMSGETGTSFGGM